MQRFIAPKYDPYPTDALACLNALGNLDAKIAMTRLRISEQQLAHSASNDMSNRIKASRIALQIQSMQQREIQHLYNLYAARERETVFIEVAKRRLDPALFKELQQETAARIKQGRDERRIISELTGEPVACS